MRLRDVLKNISSQFSFKFLANGCDRISDLFDRGIQLGGSRPGQNQAM